VDAYLLLDWQSNFKQRGEGKRKSLKSNIEALPLICQIEGRGGKEERGKLTLGKSLLNPNIVLKPLQYPGGRGETFVRRGIESSVVFAVLIEEEQSCWSVKGTF